MNKDPLRVLLTADAVGGVWQYVLDISRALTGQGIEPIIAVLGPPPSSAQLASADGIELVSTGLPLDWLCDDATPVRVAGQAIARLARDRDVDCVHLNMPTLAAGAAFEMPVVAVTHGCVSTWWEAARRTPLASQYLWHRALTGEGLRAVDLVVAPSAAYGIVIARHYDLPIAPMIVHNGRDAAGSEPQASPACHAFTAARLWDHVKNADILDMVAKRLPVPFRAAGPVMGPHGETTRLEHLQLLGTLDDRGVAGELAARPVFVSAARFEPFGLAVLEAALAGCALVLSDIPTFRELWDGAALFVPAQDDRMFAEMIERLIDDPDLRHLQGQAARARASRYTPAATAAAMARAYRRLCARANREVVAA